MHLLLTIDPHVIGRIRPIGREALATKKNDASASGEEGICRLASSPSPHIRFAARAIWTISIQTARAIKAKAWKTMLENHAQGIMYFTRYK